MTAPIALQLYTLRDLLEDDFTGGVRRVAEIGYDLAVDGDALISYRVGHSAA